MPRRKQIGKIWGEKIFWYSSLGIIMEIIMLGSEREGMNLVIKDLIENFSVKPSEVIVE